MPARTIPRSYSFEMRMFLPLDITGLEGVSVYSKPDGGLQFFASGMHSQPDLEKKFIDFVMANETQVWAALRCERTLEITTAVRTFVARKTGKILARIPTVHAHTGDISRAMRTLHR